MTLKRALGIAAGAFAAAATLAWAAFALRRRRRGAPRAAPTGEAPPAPSAWGGAAVLR
jgi:hypothetical protein